MDTLTKTAIRSAEADRISSCQFADNVAQSSIDFFRMICPKNLAEAYKQTVIAAIVVQAPINSGTESGGEFALKILSLGVGTKVLNGNYISDERKTNISSGDRFVRDCHAEVLARRGFVAYLYTELDRLLADANYAIINTPNCIFEWNQHNKLQLKPGYTLHLYTSSQPCGNASNKKWAKCKSPPQFPNLAVHQFPTEIHNKIQIISRNEGQVAVLVKKNNYKVSCDAQTDGKSGITDAVADMNTRNTIQNEHNHCSSTTASYYQCLPGTAPVNSGEGNVMTCSDKIALWNVLGLQGSLLSQYFSPLHLSTITVGRKFSKIHAERALCCRLQEYCFPVTDEVGNKNRTRNKKMKVNESNITAFGAVIAPTTDVSTAPSDSTVFSNVAELRVCGEVSSLAVDSMPVFSTNSNEINMELVNTADSFRTVYRVNHPVMLSTKVKLDESAIATAILTTNTAANSVSTGAPSAESTELGLLTTIEDTTTTGTKLHENATNTLAVGAQFTDWRSLCCWFDSNSSDSSNSNRNSTSNSNSTKNTNSISKGSGNNGGAKDNFRIRNDLSTAGRVSDYQLEMIDGRTGLLYHSPGHCTAGLESKSIVNPSLISQLSSFSFATKYKALRNKYKNNSNTSNSFNLAAQDSCDNVNHSINCTPFTYRDMKATGCVCSCAAVSNIPLYQQTIAHTIDIQEVVKDRNNSQAAEVSKTTITTTISGGDVSCGGTVDMNIANTGTYITEHTAAKRYLKSNDKFFREWIQK